ncbi:MAG: glycosyltransferase family 4 protein [Synechococcus sp.]|nr:glycosyltransferase family 4 protein [Synechococcus sp.]
MRIAFLDSWLREAAEGSGTAVAIGGLAEALRARGHQVVRIGPRGSWPRNLLLRRLWFNLTLPWRLQALLGSPAVDLIVGFDIDGVRIAARAGAAYACSIKGVLAEEARCERGWPRLMLTGLSWLERLNARRAPLVLSTSRYCLERIEAHYGVASSRLALVGEGIDPALWRCGEQERQRATILCVARQYPRKRVIDLIEAFSLVLPVCPQAELVVIGDGPEHGVIADRVRALGLSASVRLLGALRSDEEVRAWYRRATVFCLPSIQEGFGIVYLEAMAAGLPVVATTAAAIPEVVPDGQAGVLVPPRDPAALAAALLRLLQDPSLCRQLAGRGRLLVQQHSWERVADRFLAAVEPLISR